MSGIYRPVKHFCAVIGNRTMVSVLKCQSRAKYSNSSSSNYSLSGFIEMWLEIDNTSTWRYYRLEQLNSCLQVD